MNGTQKISNQGVSIWLDYLSRDLLNSGDLKDLIARKNVVGITTNPSIFQQSITTSNSYDLSPFSDVDTAVWTLIADDVRHACDVLKPVYDATGGVDGRVSIEVDPRLARDFLKTRLEVERLFRLVDRENVMIKIPATKESLPAITEALARGISVNVTLIFSHARYREVMRAFTDGLEAARKNGLDLSKIHSVASFFVSRIDTLVDSLLEQNSSPAALALRGQTAVSYARLAYQEYQNFFQNNEQWTSLAASGAHPQRPLWASTGVKNPDYPPTLYVDRLAYSGVVNTMPASTLMSVYDHSNPASYPQNTAEEAEQAAAVLTQLEQLGIHMNAVVDQLEQEGVAKFITSWQDLLADLQAKLPSKH
jgi:transaldolase